MPNDQAQDFLFERIRELLPQHIALVDAVSDILHVSSDSAYRRIRGETPLVMDEVRQLCNRFNLSLDLLLQVRTGSVLFQDIRINNKNYSYTQYLQDLLGQMEAVNNFFQKEIIYLSKDIPFFHNFYFRPLIAFRYFFWMKSMVQHPDFATLHFDMAYLTPEIESLSTELLKAYHKIPCTEIWNTENINASIAQIEFYKDSGYFNSSEEIRKIYEALEETILHMKTQVEYGCKFMPGENPQTKKSNFNFFYNRIILGDNTIIVTTDRLKTAYLNYGLLNYIVTRDETFCKNCYEDLQNLKKRSTQLSQTSERQRNIFFGILLAKINDRKKHL
ncbi:MAG TPA: helix-turn-helix domain-containing protein [Chitinophagaceae bacterium]|jgi:hypothetical protein|nr:helix-turn-helix domain-containing protein [Chitinophagaceae bacterium]